MDPLTAGAITGGLSLVGTAMSNNASAQQAKEQMQFQERMSSTAHQREVADLRKAGLNPILSALGSGASTPQGAQGTVNDFGPGISKGAETALAVRQQNKALSQMDAQIGNTEADTKNKGAQTALIANQAAQSAMDTRLKGIQSTLIEKTLPSAVKKAQIEGDYAELNQIMGLVQGGASAASDVLGIGSLLKGAAGMFKKGASKINRDSMGMPIGKPIGK